MSPYLRRLLYGALKVARREEREKFIALVERVKDNPDSSNWDNPRANGYREACEDILEDLCNGDTSA